MVAVGDFAVHLETVQMVEIPGESECGLLVGGFQRIDEYLGGPRDRFTGPVNFPTPSCPDPTDRYEVWQNRGGRIERLATDMGHDDGRPQLSLVEDTVTGQRYYLHSGEQMGGCYRQLRLPFVFRWQRVNEAWTLRRFVSPEIEQALFDQCNALDYEQVRCAGISATPPGANDLLELAPPLVPTTAYVHSRNQFMKLLRSPMFDDYQRAVMELDKPVLKRLQTDGIPGEWTAEAIRRVSASPLPLREKRKRTAWLFCDCAQLARALDFDVLQPLLTWLPRKDWAPIFKVIANNPEKHYGLEDLRSDAEKEGLTQLACDIDHAQGLICGETWGTEPADSLHQGMENGWPPLVGATLSAPPWSCSVPPGKAVQPLTRR